MKHILIVDDSKTILFYAKSVLSDTYEVSTVTSGEQALEFLKENDCDIILLDINMPDMDGFEVMHRIRSGKHANIPVIFLTADNEAKTERRCLEMGASDFITKPFVPDVMHLRIGHILELEELRKNLEKKLEERMRHITHMQQLMVLGMASMVESRDNSTGGHIKRTSGVVRIFAKKLLDQDDYMTKDFLDKVVRAAPMHDLGKITVDDAVLRKQGKFTEAEYEKMKKHAEEGAKIVRQILEGVEEEKFIKITENIAHYHHEKWDGTGYPLGLSKEMIPVEARIMALADVFDALVSKRCYKEPYSYDKAFGIMEGSLGTHFDPRLGKIFILCRPELERFYNAMNEKSQETPK